MSKFAALVTLTGNPNETEMLASLKSSELVENFALALAPGIALPNGFKTAFGISELWDRETVVSILKWFKKTNAEQLLWIFPGAPLVLSSGLRRLQQVSIDSRAPLVYSDFFDHNIEGNLTYHALIDYQPGSIRDDFDFGPVVMMNQKALLGLIEEMERSTYSIRRGGFYDLRLRLAERGDFFRLPEPTYQRPKLNRTGSSQFEYVDPRNRDYQKEMEVIASQYLKRLGALMPPPCAPPVEDGASYPVKASVVIPVKNRVRTIAGAVQSALSQEAPFDFNVIVIDNYSNDGTTNLLSDLAKSNKNLVHLIPERRDLGIGGCWNEGIFSKQCGKIAIQLDSEDLYDGKGVIARIAGEFDKTPYAFVVGSYTIVNFDLKPIPPGLIDHREWTDENGHNNALRIAGLGAPRAFHVPTLRTIGFPNVSYGEDYAVALRLCRSYNVGRIFDSLYLCRRWEENSDSSLPLETSNKYSFYKDKIRTAELLARRRLNNVG